MQEARTELGLWNCGENKRWGKICEVNQVRTGDSADVLQESDQDRTYDLTHPRIICDSTELTAPKPCATGSAE